MHAKSAQVAFSLLLTVTALPFTLTAATKTTPASSRLQDMAESKDEAFLVRRIAEFWKDEDYKLVRDQIQAFLVEFPHSKMGDHLRGILADLYLQQGSYKEALQVYTSIKEGVTLEKVLINKLQCYYELSSFEEIIREGSPYLTKKSAEVESRKEEFHFLMAEAYFRSAVTKNVGDKRVKYIEQAKPLYESIIHSSFNDPVMFALAEIYSMTGDYKKASAFFSELAGRHTERQEELFFHAALSQAEYDRNLAIETFSRLVDKEGAKAEEAALNRLILYFQEERFQDVIHAYPSVSASLLEEKQLSLDYIVGRSYFAEKNFAEAIEFLTNYIATETSSSPQFRNSLLMLMNSAQNLHNEELYSKIIMEMENLFPKDQELPQAIFIHAMMLKEKGHFLEAEQKLEQLVTHYPHFEDKETLLLEYSLVTYNNQEWEKAHTTLASFVRQYPQSSQNNIAWKYLLSSSLNLIKEWERNGKTKYTKQNFLEDLTSVIAQEKIFNSQEMQECRFLQGKVLYELGLYDQALSKLSSYLTDYVGDPSAAETHLLIALSHHKLGNHPELFCHHAEEALQINPELNNKSSIHLELYNVYLSIIEKGTLATGRLKVGTEENLSLYDLAAEHLYQSINIKDLQVKMENCLWLANYYYDKLVKPTSLFETHPSTDVFETDTHYQRSYQLFDSILTNSSQNLLPLTAEETHLEWEVLKFANLLGKEKKLLQKMQILKDLAQQQQANRSWSWKLQKETLLELAKTYEYLQDRENAYETYAFIALNYRNTPTFVSEFAALHAHRLQFHLLPKEKQNEENDQIVKILNYLKELQIRKQIDSEPIHLEAAIEYSWIRAHMADKNQSDRRYNFFLHRIQEDYSNQEDPILVRYKDLLKKQPEKQELYDLYQQFVRAEILRTEALMAEKSGDRETALQCNQQAAALLQECATSSRLTHYLYNRIQSSQHAMLAGKLY